MGRQILGQLRELQSCSATQQAYEDLIAREKEQDAKEKELAEQRLQVEREKTALAEKRADLEKERGDMFESLYIAKSKKTGGFKCFLKRFFTAGLSRC